MSIFSLPMKGGGVGRGSATNLMQLPIESINLQMLNVGFARHDGDWNWQDVQSPFARVYYVTEGYAKVYLATGVIELRPHHLYIIPSYTKHTTWCDGKFCHYYLHVYEAFRKEADIFEYYDFPSEVKACEGDERVFADMCRLYPYAALPASDPSSYDFASKFNQYVKRYNDMPLYAKMELRGSILLLMSRFIRYATPCVWTTDDRISGVLDYIHLHLNDELDADVLSKVACVSKPYLTRIFQRHFNTSPLQYINQKKVEKAQLLLLTDDLTIKEIAYSLGYSDQSYFVRVFKKVTGLTPTQYREEMR